ncbi:hypothetical protein UFOVP221_84 [uncultured Caudovirales phage]|uniref:Uncharacterized protein n=1 Tax=uncultured Caudovirales phage TaxID=2100421 RepID=A0A6J7WN80_9CAUD|nr:hypothetical protein UFOVP221_84 [uncultured Caudovirales phage]
MADINSLIAKVRVELGDLGKSFVTQFTADGTTNRFRLHYAPLDGDGVSVYANGNDVSASAWVEESTGMLSVQLAPTEIAITDAVGDETNVVYTADNTLSIGSLVTITGMTPIVYNGIDLIVVDSTPTSFTVANTTADAYVSGGTAYDVTAVALGAEVPRAGTNFTVSGTYYRYFTAAEITSLVEAAAAQHAHGHTDSVGRRQLLSTLNMIDEYPIAVYATALGLFTLATDASFDIDIAAPDGVSIPRSERYRQLMDMVQARQAQYRELCSQLGIGLYKIDVFSLRRISKTTNRYVPVYKPQEVDDRSFPQRAHLSEPTYGDQAIPFPTENGELTAYQTRAYSGLLSLTGNYAGKKFSARLVLQRGSIQLVQPFELSVSSSLSNYTITEAARSASSTAITLTTDGNHNLAVGTSVVITDVDDTVNGTYTVAAPVTSTTFKVVGTATTALALTTLSGTVDVNAVQEYGFTMSLTADQTTRLANRTWWEIRTTDSITGEKLVIDEGNFFTVRVSEVIL